MDVKYNELFKLQYEKLLNSTKIIYDTISSYKQMAFSQKEMMKELDYFVQALLLEKLLAENLLLTETLVQLNETFIFGKLLKAIKYHPKRAIDDKVNNNIKKFCSIKLKVKPLFIKLGLYFDQSTTKFNLNGKISYIEMIVKIINSMLSLVVNIDDQNNDSTNHQYLNVIYSYIKE